MRVIGTAGHIDHGKSSLVLALTGTDPDRLPEEKARGMTIELGFAWLQLPDGQAAGVIDVPGHERFVRHMLAGVGGIDLALLVIAADETMMPQTREHLAILDLLDVRHGVVALTKRDLVDEEWLELAIEEVCAGLADTTLADSPIIPCSSLTGEGLDTLRATLAEALAATPERPDRGRPHLPIDRVFTLTGHGTVVTGTLLDGTLALGQEVEFAPIGRRARIRGLHSHHERVEGVGPGRRVAVNVGGVAVEELARGMVLCLPGGVPSLLNLDLRVRVTRDGEVRHNMPIVLHTGAAEAPGTLRLLDADHLGPGQEGWAQVRLAAPIAALRGDRCVLRIPSPAATVAGGTIAAVNPPRHRRHARAVLEKLAAAGAATPEERVLDALAPRPATAGELAVRADFSPELVKGALAGLVAGGQARALRPAAVNTHIGQHDGRSSSWATSAWLAATERRAASHLAAYHRRYPLRRGMPGEALREALGIERRPWAELLDTWRTTGVMASEGDLLRAPDHRIQFTAAQEREATTLLARLAEQPRTPPALSELGVVDPELLAALLERGDPVRIADGILLRRDAYEAMRDTALRLIGTEGQVTVAMLRDTAETSRKYALALLEHLDDLRLTRRIGDARVLGAAGLPAASE